MADIAPQRFAFRFDPTFRPMFALAGITPERSWVEVTEDHLRARFGAWSLRTPRSNVAEARITGPYKRYRAVGIRLSLSDRGVTFGSTAERGVCVRFHEPVSPVVPFVLHAHPNATFTVEDCEGLVAVLKQGPHL